MPPRNRIEAITIHSTQHWPSGSWIPMRIEVNSWVTLQPDPASEWGQDSGRYAVDTQQYLWKAQVLGFKFRSDGNQIVSKVLVRHAYEPRQLYLDPDQPHPRLPCNYLFPCYFDDWVEPDSIVGVILGMHADIGEPMHHARPHRELYEASIFFYKWIYVPPAGARLYGELEPIPLPHFDSPSWPLPDMNTSEAFRGKMRADFQQALKPNTGSRRSHIQWFMPFAVFVDLFASATNRIRTPQLFTIKSLEDQVFSDIMDPGWHKKTTYDGDIVQCIVALPSVVFRYHMGRQTLYVNFFFTRARYVALSWVPIEQEVGEHLVELECHVMDNNPPTMIHFNVGTDWPVAHLRHEVQITMGNNAPTDFNFFCSEPNKLDRKINIRAEKILTVADVLPPKILKIRIV